MDFLHVIVAALFHYASRRSEIIFREATLRTSATPNIRENYVDKDFRFSKIHGE